MKKLTLIIAFVLIAIGCSKRVEQAEYDKLKAELSECKKNVEDLQNTPQVRLLNGQQFLSKNDFVNAKREFNELIEKFRETDEANKAKYLIANIEKQEKEKKEADERKRTLGFKALKESSLVNAGEVSISFNYVTIGQEWIFDNYGGEWRYRNAERGEKYVLAKVSISSDNKNPSLPPVGIYYIANGTLSLIGTMGYEFSRWDDYASYLGNDHDFKNDFAHTKTIPFSLGLAVSYDIITNNAVFVVVEKSGCFNRSKNRYRNPPVSYNSSGCQLKTTLAVDDFDKDYVLVKVLNKNKL